MARPVNSTPSKDSPDRRSFVRRVGLASVVAGSAVSLRPQTPSHAASDVDLLNFALNLEYLTAEFYTVATTSRTVDQYGVVINEGAGVLGVTSGGGLVPFDGNDYRVHHMAEELALAERTHVSVLQNAIVTLGGAYSNKPSINLDAFNFGFASQMDFLQLARGLEELSLSTYSWISRQTTTKSVLSAVAGLLASEGEHTGALRTLLNVYGGSARGVLDGLDVATPSLTTPVGTSYFSTDAKALGSIRTPGEILHLLYAGGSLTSGGFFPYGLNASADLGRSDPLPAAPGTPLFSASPNPIPLAPGAQYGATTVTWDAPLAQYVEIRVGSPSGALFTTSLPTGSLKTNVWINDGLVLYLQDISDGKPLTARHTLATLIMRTYSA